MGAKRVIAETGAGQHGVATATACAMFGMDCTIQSNGARHCSYGNRSIHILNAPSPAATASIEIGKEMIRHLEKFRLVV